MILPQLQLGLSSHLLELTYLPSIESITLTVYSGSWFLKTNVDRLVGEFPSPKLEPLVLLLKTTKSSKSKYFLAKIQQRSTKFGEISQNLGSFFMVALLLLVSIESITTWRIIQLVRPNSLTRQQWVWNFSTQSG